MADNHKDKEGTAGVSVKPGAKLGLMHDVVIEGFDDGVRNEGEIGTISSSRLHGQKRQAKKHWYERPAGIVALAVLAMGVAYFLGFT